MAHDHPFDHPDDPSGSVQVDAEHPVSLSEGRRFESDLGLHLAPNVKAVLAEHPAFPASLRELASWGEHVLEQAPQPRGVRMASWETILEAVERHVRKRTLLDEG